MDDKPSRESHGQDPELIEMIRNMKLEEENKRQALKIQKKAEKRMVPRKHQRRF